jgi:proliferating cell nuclear antigen PCNA
MSKELVSVTTENISAFKAICTMLEEVTEDDINIRFKKCPKQDSDESNDDDDDSDTKSKKPQQGGVTIRAMNAHQTLVAMIKLEVCGFTKFHVKDEEFSCWLSITELNKCIKDIESEGYKLTMLVEKNDNKSMKLIVEHKEKENRKEEYPLSFVENDVDIPNIPCVEFDLSIKMSTALFRKVCTKAKKFASTILMKCDTESLIFEYKINESSTKKVTISYGDGDEIKITPIKKKGDVNVQMSYLLDSLLSLKYSSVVSDKMELFLKNKNPLFIRYKITENKENIGKMLVYLSPSDDNDNNNDNYSNYHDKTKDVYKDKQAIMKGGQ